MRHTRQTTNCKAYNLTLSAAPTIAFIVVGIIIILFACILSNSRPVYGDSPQSSGGGSGDSRSADEITDRVKKFYSYTKAQACYDVFNANPDYGVSPSKIETSMYGDPNSAMGVSSINFNYFGFTERGGAGTPCSASEITDIASDLGLDIDFEQILKDKAGYNRDRCPEGEANQTSSQCWNSIKTGDVAKAIKSNILDKASDSSSSTMQGADWFAVYNNAFDICVDGDDEGMAKYSSSTDITGDIGDDGSSGVWKFPGGSTFSTKNDDGTFKSEVVYAKVDRDEYKWGGFGNKVAHSVWYGTSSARDNITGGYEENCDEIAENVRTYFPAYIRALNNNILKTGESPSQSDINSSLNSSDTSTDDGSEDSCEAGFQGFGWIFCPGQNLVTELIDGLLGFVNDSMKWTIIADQASDEQGNNVRDIWQKFLNIANVVFAIIFMVMIYSMATSTGLSNYDIKKMLPRLIVIAIAVNISFYLCAALVDLSNIMGSIMYGFIYGQANSGDAWSIVGNIVNIISSSVLLVLTLFAFGGAVIIALLVIVACLALRQVLLVVLIIISPVAIALYILPNTAKWSRQWFNMFIRLLIIYPAFTSIWGAARLISNTFATTGSGGLPGFVMDFVCAIAPAIAIIPLFKASGTVVGTLAGAMAGSAAARRGKSWINERTRRNPLTRAAARGVSKHAENLSGRAASVPLFGGALRRGLRGAANYTSDFGHSLETKENQLDERSLEAGKTANLGLSDSQLEDIATKGRYTVNNGKVIAVDVYRRRAAMDKIGSSLSAEKVEEMMVNASDIATEMMNTGRSQEARGLLNSALNAGKASNNLFMSASAQTSYANGDFGDKEHAQMHMTQAVAQNASKLSQQKMSTLPGATNKYLRNKVEQSDNSDYMMAYSKTASDLYNNEKLRSNMNAEALEQVRKSAEAYRISQSHAGSSGNGSGGSDNNAGGASNDTGSAGGNAGSGNATASGTVTGAVAGAVASGAAQQETRLSQNDKQSIANEVRKEMRGDIDSINTNVQSTGQSTSQSIANVQEVVESNSFSTNNAPSVTQRGSGWNAPQNSATTYDRHRNIGQ